MTGSSGLIGRELVHQLVSSGHETVGLVRNRQQADLVKGLGAEALIGDIMKEEDCRRVARNVEVVFHLAARVSFEDESLVRPPMVEGTTNMLKACYSNSVRKFVYASSVSVYGDARGGWVNEDSPFNPNTAYGRAKVEAEAQVIHACHEGWLNAIILRPSWVYGVNDVLFRLMGEGRLTRWVGSGENYWGYVHVEDVARAFIVAGERVEKDEKAYIVTDDEPSPWRDYLHHLADLQKASPPRHVPYWLSMVSASLRSVFRNRKRISQLDSVKSGRPAITPDTVRAAKSSARFSNRRIKEELGFSVRYPNYRDGLRSLVAPVPELSANRQ